MTQPNPKLSCREAPPAGLIRPTFDHPVLGTMEYINRDGGWWQGVTAINGVYLRLDLNTNAKPTPKFVAKAAECIQFLQKNEGKIRAAIAKRLEAGEYSLELGRSVAPTPISDAAAVLSKIRPTMVLFARDICQLEYDCTACPGGVLGATGLSVTLDKGELQDETFLYSQPLDSRARQLLERRLPADASDFVNSIADQFLVKLSEYSKIDFDEELLSLLENAVADVKARMKRGLPECASYMAIAYSILSELARIAKISPLPIEGMRVDLRVRHPAGKRKPFKDKLVFTSGEEARFHGSGSFPRISLFGLSDYEFKHSENPKEAFENAAAKKWQSATKWLAKNSPTVFQELRDAGFTTTINVFAIIRNTTMSLRMNWPLEFLAECTRHGVGIEIDMCHVSQDS